MSDLVRAAHGVLLAAFAGPDLPVWLGPAYRSGLAGICLYGNNLAPGRDLAALASAVRAQAPGAVLALDEEGGDVTRLHAATGSPYVGAAALGRYDDEELTRAVAAGIGAELAEAGVWLDLAPCADVNSDPANPVIGTRSFGADPQLVGRHVAAFVAGLAEAGVAASVKHFPGHGDTSLDSHLALPVVSASRQVLQQRELVPFRAAVAAGAASVMTSHVVLSAVDPEQPATLSSPVLTGLLRGELGYRGVVVTDALDMAGASAVHGLGGAAVRSLVAGADLLCLGPEPDGADGALVSEVVDHLVRAVGRGELPGERLLDAAARVAALRQEWTGRAGTRRRHLVQRAQQASVRVAEALASSVAAIPPAAVLHVETGASPAVGQTIWGLPSLGGPESRVRGADLPTTPVPEGPVVVVARRAGAHDGVREWVLRALGANPHAVLVELGWPDPRLEAHPRVVHTWGSAAVSTAAVARALRGHR